MGETCFSSGIAIHCSFLRLQGDTFISDLACLLTSEVSFPWCVDREPASVIGDFRFGARSPEKPIANLEQPINRTPLLESYRQAEINANFQRIRPVLDLGRAFFFFCFSGGGGGPPRVRPAPRCLSMDFCRCVQGSPSVRAVGGPRRALHEVWGVGRCGIAPLSKISGRSDTRRWKVV